LITIFKEIGTIPNIELYDSERANCADVVDRSLYHEYSLLGDAKEFRLSRKARNQKDFRIKSLRRLEDRK
jgi:hypothetical protein